MRPIERYLRVFTLVALLAQSLPRAGAAGEPSDPIIVELKDGRAARGETDKATDDHYLWLRKETAGIQLLSGYYWADIRQVGHAGTIYSAEQFRLEVQRLATPAKHPAEIPPYPAADFTEATTTDRQAESLPPPPLPKIASLQIEACLGQWDNDAQPDGLWVALFPLTANGTPAPVRGQVDLTLFGELEPAIGGRSDLVRPQFQELSRTSELVRPIDFTRGPAIVRLPFRQFQPERNPDISRTALVQARLGVPGQGVFEAVDANVNLRGESRIRDQLQLHTGRRFFPAERVPTPGRD